MSGVLKTRLYTSTAPAGTSGGSSSGAANEIQKGDGSGGFAGTKIFNSADGNVELGDGTLAGNRTIAVEGSGAERLLNFTFPGATTGGIFLNAANAYQQIVDSVTSRGLSIVGSSQSIRGVTNGETLVKGYSAGSGIAGDLAIEGGDGGSGTGGDLILSPGIGGTANGNLVMQNIPTSSVGLPSGAVWSNAGVLTIVP